MSHLTPSQDEIQVKQLPKCDISDSSILYTDLNILSNLSYFSLWSFSI